MRSQPASDSRGLIGPLVRANELRRQQDYRAAIELYLEALGRFGEDADLLALIAHCYFVLAVGQLGTDQDYSDAVTWMERAIALAPTNACLHSELAQLYWLGGLDYEQAAQRYRRALEFNPNDVRALVGAAALYGVPDDVVTIEEAIGWLERAVQLEPRDPNYLFRLGELYWEANRPLDAEQVWLKALQCPLPLGPSPAQIIEKTLATG